MENTSSTLFRIGSLTQLFTTVAVLQLSQAGLINLSSTAGKYIEQFPSNKDTITIEHLLTNTSGIPDYSQDSHYENGCPSKLSLDELLKLFINKPLEFDPGARFSFSNSNAIVLGWLIESVTGVSFEGYVRQHILEPLRLQNTGYYSSKQIIPNLAYGYSLEHRNQIINAPVIDNSRLYSSAGYYSTLADLMLLVQGIMSDKLISSYGRKLIMTPKHNSYTMGWYVDEPKTKRDELFMNNFQKKHCWMLGKLDGYFSLLSYYPEDNVLIIALSNNDWAFLNSQMLLYN